MSIQASSTSTSTPTPPPAPAPLWWCLTTCLLYGVGSTALTFVNKALFYSWQFPYSATLLVMQMGVAVLLAQIWDVGVLQSVREQSSNTCRNSHVAPKQMDIEIQVLFNMLCN